jgi:hypothetical protein
MASRLSDGRLHLQHGPIDLVILGDEVEYQRATCARRGGTPYGRRSVAASRSIHHADGGGRWRGGG